MLFCSVTLEYWTDRSIFYYYACLVSTASTIATADFLENEGFSDATDFD